MNLNELADDLVEYMEIYPDACYHLDELRAYMRDHRYKEVLTLLKAQGRVESQCGGHKLIKKQCQ
jgi:hypothetical protein